MSWWYHRYWLAGNIDSPFKTTRVDLRKSFFDPILIFIWDTVLVVKGKRCSSETTCLDFSGFHNVTSCVWHNNNVRVCYCCKLAKWYYWKPRSGTLSLSLCQRKIVCVCIYYERSTNLWTDSFGLTALTHSDGIHSCDVCVNDGLWKVGR